MTEETAPIDEEKPFGHNLVMSAEDQKLPFGELLLREIDLPYRVVLGCSRQEWYSKMAIPLTQLNPVASLGDAVESAFKDIDRINLMWMTISHTYQQRLKDCQELFDKHHRMACLMSLQGNP